MTKELCDLKTIAKYLCVSEAFIRKMVSLNKIPFHKLGGKLIFDVKEINEWVDTCKNEERRRVLLI